MGEQTRVQWTDENILAFLRERADEMRAMGVRKIGLFGSYARGEQGPESDMDFLLSIEDWSWKRWSRVWNFLEDSFGVKVDLVPEEDLRPELRSVVLAEVRYVQNL